MVPLAEDKEHGWRGRRATGSGSFPASMGVYRRFNICRSAARWRTKGAIFT
jgi:hypothetical protein